MWKSYFNAFIRNVAANKLMTGLSVAGFSISMAIGISLLSNVNSHLKTDHFHPFMDRISRVVTESADDEGRKYWATCPGQLKDSLRQLSFVEQLSLVTLNRQDKLIGENGDVDLDIAFGDEEFFKIFGFEVFPQQTYPLLDDPAHAILTEDAAQKLFGQSDPVGETLTLRHSGTFIVAGIIRKPASRTHLKFEAILSDKSAAFVREKSRESGNSVDFRNTSLYVLTRFPGNLASLNTVLEKISIQADREKGDILKFYAQNIDDISPWDPKIRNDLNAGYNRGGLRNLMVLAGLFTLLAGMNYSSLCASKVIERAKEIGIRKIAGASGGDILQQVLFESVLLSLITLCLVYPVILILNRFEATSFLEISPSGTDFVFILVAGAYAVITGLVAGLVPALMIANVKLINVLRNLGITKKRKILSMQEGLLAIQFMLVVVSIIFSLSIRSYQGRIRDDSFMKLPPDIYILGNIRDAGAPVEKVVANLSGVQRVSPADYLPAYASTPHTMEVTTGGDTKISLPYATIDENFVDLFRLSLAAGSNLASNSGTYGVLLNEAASKRLFPSILAAREIIGERFSNDTASFQVTGIISDTSFHVHSVFPIIFLNSATHAGSLAIRLQPGATSENIRQMIRRSFDGYEPELYNYKARVLDSFDSGIAKFNRALTFLVSVLILIACIGLFGVAGFHFEKNIKALSIRKIVGAGNIQLIYSAARPLIKILLISIASGVPLAALVTMTIGKSIDRDVSVSLLNVFTGVLAVAFISGLVIISQISRVIYIRPAAILKEG